VIHISALKHGGILLSLAASSLYRLADRTITLIDYADHLHRMAFSVQLVHPRNPHHTPGLMPGQMSSCKQVRLGFD
jgi:hypothetical protein